ncbi:MAG: SDR family oxidoreductase [Proteobacteria bacterium]|nr:MAG: SDR family oxidoreductase [Pseudomonadota bacterium]
MKQKIALVTGANKGIGYALVKELATAGYEVWLGARSSELGQKAAKELGDQVHFLALDVTSDAGVAAAAKLFASKRDHLDLLVNNAGIYLMDRDGVPSKTSIETIKEAHDVNFLGPIRVTQAFLPLIKKSAQGKILNVSSGLGSLNLILDDGPNGFAGVNVIGYNSSKAALNMFSALLSNELKDSKIQVNSICPGYVATDLNAHSGPLTTEQSAKGLMEFINRDGFTTGHFIKQGGEHPW